MNYYLNSKGIFFMIVFQFISFIHCYSFLAEQQKKCSSKSDCFSCGKEYNCYWNAGHCTHNSTKQSTGSRWHEKFSQCKFQEQEIQSDIYKYCINAQKTTIPLNLGISYQAFEDNKTEVYCEWTIDSLNPTNQYKFLFYLHNITKYRTNNFVLVLRYAQGIQEKSLIHDYYNKTVGITGFTLYYYGKNLTFDDYGIFTFKVKRITVYPKVIILILLGLLMVGIVVCILFAFFKERREENEKIEMELQKMNEYIERINQLLNPVKYSSIVKNQDQTICTICIEEFKDKDMISQLKCKHLFHYDCIRKWIEMTYQNPKCCNCNMCLIKDIPMNISTSYDNSNDVTIQVNLNLNVDMNMNMNLNLSNATSIAIL